MTDERPLAVFGGSFNPPHVGHVLAVAYVLSTESVAGVAVVPVYQHPFSKELAPFEDRFRMCELAMAWLPFVEISRIEEDLGGESRTLSTLRALHREAPERGLRLVVGADLLAERDKWHRWEDIETLAPPIVLGRRGVRAREAPPALLPDLSSTEVRDAIAAGDEETLRRALPRDVLAYIRHRGLYA